MDQNQSPEGTGTDPAARQQAMMRALRAQLDPWYQAVESPARAQASVLARYPKDYARTRYGSDHGAAALAEAYGGGDPNGRADGAEDPLIAAYRRAFPVMTYGGVQAAHHRSAVGRHRRPAL